MYVPLCDTLALTRAGQTISGVPGSSDVAQKVIAAMRATYDVMSSVSLQPNFSRLPVDASDMRRM